MSINPRDAIEEEDDSEEFDMINANLGFFDPVPDDSTTLSAFMPRFVPINRLEFARAICCQKMVGTIIKDQVNNMPGDSFFGFASVLNLGVYKDVLPSFGTFIDWMIDLKDPALTDILTNHLGSTGLILSERARGVPDVLAPHLMRGLFEEIEWATEDMETEEDRNSYRFTHYIMVKKIPRTDDGLVFPNIEDELFYKAAPIKVPFETEGEEGDPEGVEYLRTVFVFPADAVPDVRNELNAMFGINEADYADEGKK